MRRRILSTTFGLVCLFFLCAARQARAGPSNRGSNGQPARAQSSAGTVYYCVSSWANSAVYFSERENGGAQRAAIGAFQTPFLAFLQKKYAYNSGSNYPVECGVSFPPNAGGLQAAQKYKQGLEDLAKQGNKQIVETGWTASAP